MNYNNIFLQWENSRFGQYKYHFGYSGRRNSHQSEPYDQKQEMEEGLWRVEEGWLREERRRMPGKVKNCLFRFINHLDPTVNKELWSDEEL